MHDSLLSRIINNYPGRKIAISLQWVILAVCILGVIPGEVFAQSKPAGSGKSPLCNRDNAVEMIKQQIDITKAFKDPVQRLAVLIRAADMLWPYEQERARAVFSEAFELATENEQENEQKGPRSLILRLQIPDQRYVVIRAVTKRDPAWAKELTQQMLKRDTEAREATSTRNSFNDLLTAERLLDSAKQMIATDIKAAFDLARASLNYPASGALTRFLYRLAEVNQPAADQFYAQALAIYRDKPLREFLYLQAYPFAWRETVNTPTFDSYVVPANFVTTQSLQRQFVQVLLRRAHQVLETPLDQGDTYRDPRGTLLPGTAHLLQALMLLEPQIKGSLPDLLAPLTEAREKILVSLSVDTQKRLMQPGREVSITQEKTFDEQIESAQKVPDVDRRDELIAEAVLSTFADTQSLAGVIQAIDKISDSNLRNRLIEWLYFRRATAAVKDKQFEEAEKLASQVEGMEQRAYLHIEIAKGLFSRNERAHARDILDEAITEAKKAGATIFAARTLLTASNLYTKIDPGAAISLLTDAINCINRIDGPDFSSDNQTQVKMVERKGRSGHYPLRFYMPGLDPESAFREMAKVDFDISLSQSSAITDKFQRAMSTLALADTCLQQAQQQPKAKPKRAADRKSE
jgi:tetratricopeptide (TPR) repeat protein